MHAALYLVVVLAGLAANYILLAAEFVAITQVLVYIGAVIVLFLFGIMLTRARIGQERDLDTGQWPSPCWSPLLLGGVLGYALIDAFDDDRAARARQLRGRQHAAGQRLGLRPPTSSRSRWCPCCCWPPSSGAIVLARRD